MPSEDRLSNAFRRTRRAVRGAFDNVRAATGQKSRGPDPEIETYKRLTPTHLRILEARYGKANMERYIRTMERRING